MFARGLMDAEAEVVWETVLNRRSKGLYVKSRIVSVMGAFDTCQLGNESGNLRIRGRSSASQRT